MRRIRLYTGVALYTLLLVCVCSAQQLANNRLTSSGRRALPIGINGPVIGGDGTPNYIPLWRTPNYLQSSAIYQTSAGLVGIGTTSPQSALDVNGGINIAATYNIGGLPVVSTAGEYDLFVGLGAGFNNTGFLNTFAGFSAGYSNTTGSFNSFYGDDAGSGNMTGSYNTFVGVDAGQQNFTGSNNTFIGLSAGLYNFYGNSDIYVGSKGHYGSTESYAIRIGSPYTTDSTACSPVPPPCGQTAVYIAGIYGSNSSSGVPVYVNSDGQLGTLTSSLRFKEHVRDMGDSTGALMRLRPVTFFYKPEYENGPRTLQFGLIAEEVAKVYPELVEFGMDGQPYSVRYHFVTTMLLNEVQKEYRRAKAQDDVIKAQVQKIEGLEQRLSRIEALLGTQLAAIETKRNPY